MEEKIFSLSHLVINLGISKKIPDNLQKFLSLDDQGMEGLEFMMKDPKLSLRIPSEVRAEYEIFSYELMSEIEKNLDVLEKQIAETRNNLRPMANTIISKLYDEQKKEC